MSLSLFVPSWHANVSDITSHIKIALASRFGAEPARGPLTRASDQLYEILRELDLRGFEEENHTLYTMFFDALSYLCEALYARPVNRSFLASSMTILDELLAMQSAY